MTREEAKRELLFAKREVMAGSYIDKAYDMAIKALEQPEIIYCINCGWWNKKERVCHKFGHNMEDDDFCSLVD